jgi:hypothetical protein
MLNPQFAWSLIPLLLLLIGLNGEKRRYRDYMLYGIYSMVAIGLKFYTGTAMLLIIAFDLLIVLIKEKKQLVPIIVKGLTVVGMTAIAVWTFYSPGKSSGFPFTFSPLTTVNPIIEDQNLLYLSQWAQRLYDYKGIRLVVLEAAVLAVFLVLNYGTRIISVLTYFKDDKLSKKYTRALISVGALSTLLLATMLVQRGVWWNTVQFLYVSLFLTGILAAEAVDKLLTSRRMINYSIILLIVVLTIPTNLDVIRTFTKFPGTAYIADSELQALQALNAMEAGVVLTPPFGPKAKSGKVPDLGRTYDTAYVAAYSGKQTYLSDLIQLELTNIEYKSRQEMVEKFDCQVLEEVEYLYEYQDYQYVNLFSGCNVKIDRVFGNEAVYIYRIN